MSLAFRMKFGDKGTHEDARQFTLGPGARYDKSGRIIYFTEQSHKDRCDVNAIISRFSASGVLEHVRQFEGEYGECTGADFKEMVDKLYGMRDKFLKFPPEIRNRFDNDPSKLLDFLDDPGNKEEALKLGLARGEWFRADGSLDIPAPEAAKVEIPSESP